MKYKSVSDIEDNQDVEVFLDTVRNLFVEITKLIGTKLKSVKEFNTAIRTIISDTDRRYLLSSIFEFLDTNSALLVPELPYINKIKGTITCKRDNETYSYKFEDYLNLFNAKNKIVICKFFMHIQYKRINGLDAVKKNSTYDSMVEKLISDPNHKDLGDLISTIADTYNNDKTIGKESDTIASARLINAPCVKNAVMDYIDKIKDTNKIKDLANSLNGIVQAGDNTSSFIKAFGKNITATINDTNFKIPKNMDFSSARQKVMNAPDITQLTPDDITSVDKID